ncbi:MAG: sigma-70 family RNA polymerase sigma factor [Nitriliruptorales bacterium]|nr:sigma-70 family RNA polymerase sigma factor [Nitriliruptorales bacterium]
MTFEQAYQAWYRRVVGTVWAIVRDGAVAEELAQEAFVRAYTRWRRLRGLDHAEAWVHRTAMNLALSFRRRRQHGTVIEATHAAALVGPSEPEIREGWLVPLLRQLPRRQREAVFLRVVADLSEAEVAGVMGCSEGAVKVHKKRGLDRLHALVTEGADHAARQAAATAHL